jgi:hypothetical protein
MKRKTDQLFFLDNCQSYQVFFSKDCPQITADFISPYLDLRKVLVSNGTSSKNDTTHLTQDGKVFSNKPFDMKF